VRPELHAQNPKELHALIMMFVVYTPPKHDLPSRKLQANFVPEPEQAEGERVRGE
jgi:hypothetical protein